MLNFIFTIDGDWEEYYEPSLPEEKRKPDKKRLLSWFNDEIKLACQTIGGRFLHFVHTSPRARDFFLQPEFISQYKEMEKVGGDLGVHCHEDDPHRAYYFDDEARMKKAINFLVEGLRKNSLMPWAYRGGYMAFSPKIIPILEENRVFLDFSCEPGRYLFHENLLVSDWQGAPDNYYRLDYRDHRRPGNSQVFEVPLGGVGHNFLYIERTSLWQIWRIAETLKRKSGLQMVSVLAHSYEFGSALKRWKIKLALLILKRYGTFINAREALNQIKGVEKS